MQSRWRLHDAVSGEGCLPRPIARSRALPKTRSRSTPTIGAAARHAGADCRRAPAISAARCRRRPKASGSPNRAAQTPRSSPKRTCAAGFRASRGGRRGVVEARCRRVHRGRRGLARSASRVSGPAPAGRTVPARGPARRRRRTVLRVLNRFASTRLPPILRRHYDMVVETMTSRHEPAQRRGGSPCDGFRAGGADAVRPPCRVRSQRLSGVVEDAVAMLRECQGASEEDEEAALGRVCEHAQRRLEAAAVAFFGIERPPVGAPCRSWFETRCCRGGARRRWRESRSRRTGSRIASSARCRSAAEVSSWARWRPAGRSASLPTRSRAVSVLTMAATAAAPLVQSMLAARARAAVPASHGLLGVSAAMNDIRRAAERAAAGAVRGADRRRERQRQGTGGPGGASRRRAPRSPVLHAQLRGAARRSRGIGALRSRARSVHRRRGRTRRRVRGSALRARCSSTKSASCRRGRRRSCCA